MVVRIQSARYTEGSAPRLARDQNSANATVTSTSGPTASPSLSPFLTQSCSRQTSMLENCREFHENQRGCYRVPTMSLSPGGHDPSARPRGLNPNPLLPVIIILAILAFHLVLAILAFHLARGQELWVQLQAPGWESHGPRAQGPSILQRQRQRQAGAGEGQSPGQGTGLLGSHPQGHSA